MDIFTPIVVIVVLIGLLMIVSAFKDLKKQLWKKEMRLTEYETNERVAKYDPSIVRVKRLEGTTNIFGPEVVEYKLISLDNGNSWMEIDKQNTILRKARPRLVRYAKANANCPFRVTSVANVQMLNDLGFQKVVK